MTNGDYPSIPVAYDIARQSYSLISDRLDAVDGRLDNLTTLAVSITLAVPTVVKVALPNVSFASRWFVAGIVVFVLTVGVGVIGRVGGTIRLTNPKKLYIKWLSLSEWEFKRKYIWFAGKSYEKGKKRINTKGNIAIGMAVGLAIEVLCLVLWIAGS